MCLRFVFLLITRTASWLRLSQREETWKIAEILLLRHQLAVVERRRPRRPDVDWAGRALHATLLAVIPKVRHYGLRLVTPDTIVRWHRDIVRRRWAARSACGRTGRPAAATSGHSSSGYSTTTSTSPSAANASPRERPLCPMLPPAIGAAATN
jgi:hypothetical protein